MNYNLKLLRKPVPYQPGTLTLWSNEYIGKNVLKIHLDGNIDSGSRRSIIIQKTVEWILKKFYSAKRILDIGCGPGLYAPLLCQGNLDYEGFDVSPYQINYAEKHNSISGKTQFTVCDFRSWSSDKRYDVALLLYGIYSFYCYEERISFLKKLKRSLNVNGCVIIEVFTERHYQNRTDSSDWEFIEKDGFWCETPYLELNAFRRYNETGLVLIQTAVIDQKVEIWNSWIQTFSIDSIEKELYEAGFAYYEVYGSCFGEPYTSESEVICICAYLVEQNF